MQEFNRARVDGTPLIGPAVEPLAARFSVDSSWLDPGARP
jgi:hypothetical protein